MNVEKMMVAQLYIFYQHCCLSSKSEYSNDFWRIMWFCDCWKFSFTITEI